MDTSAPLHTRFEGFVLDEANARVLQAGTPVDLRPRAFAVLCTLVRHAGRLVSSDAVLDAVWGHQHVSESVLKNTVSQLRTALDDDPKSPRYIETVPRRGYRFVATLAPVRSGTQEAPSAGGLVAREGPLATLAGHLARAREGRSQLVFLAGEAGIGKSALVRRFAEAAGVDHALGQCIEPYGDTEPYLPVLEALNALCRADAAGGLVDLMRQVAPTWLVQLPWYLTEADRQQLQREVAGATQQRMLREFGELLDRVTAARPLLLVLEDLHWADSATVQLVGYLARRQGAARLLLAGTLRPAEIIAGEHPLAGLRQELRLHRLCEEIDLEAFSEQEVAAYLRLRCGAELPEDFVRQLHAHTDGLPLFVVHLVDALLADDVLRQVDGQWQVRPLGAFEVPRGIVGVIEKQIARLAADVRERLAVASVAGTEFLDAVVAHALGEPVQALREGLDDLVRQRHWLRAAGWATFPDGRSSARFEFRHALYRRVCYQSLGEARQVHWHLRIAEALEALHADAMEAPAELAMHCERGRDLPRALGYRKLAARRALARFAPAEALQAVRQALAVVASLPAGPARDAFELDLRVLEGVSLAQLQAFADDEVRGAFERAQELCATLPESPALAPALQGLWWYTFGSARLQAARALATRLLGIGHASGDAGLLVAGGGALGLTLTHFGEVAEARRQLLAALEAYEGAGGRPLSHLFVQDPAVEAMSHLAILGWWQGRPDEAREWMARALATADRTRHPPTRAMALHVAATLHVMAREYEDALRTTERIYQLADNHWLAGRPSAPGWAHGRAVVALGDADEGLREMRAAADRSRTSGLRIGLAGFHHMYADACRAAGQPGEALAAIEQGLELVRHSGERCVLSPLHRLQAELLLAAGDAAAAARALEVALQEARTRGALLHEVEALAVACRASPDPAPGALQALREALSRCGAGRAPGLDEARAIAAAAAD